MPSPPRTGAFGTAFSSIGMAAAFSLAGPQAPSAAPTSPAKGQATAFGGAGLYGVGAAAKFAWGLQGGEEEKENAVVEATAKTTTTLAGHPTVTLKLGAAPLRTVVAHKRPRGDDAEEDDDAASTGAAGGSDDEDDDECDSEGQSRAKRGRGVRSILRVGGASARSERERGERRLVFAEDVKSHDGLCRVHHIFDKIIWDHFAKCLYRTPQEVVELVGDDIKLYPELLDLFDGLADRIACSSVERAVLPGGGGSAAKLSPLHLSALLRLRAMVAQVGSETLGVDLTAASTHFEGPDMEGAADSELAGEEEEEDEVAAELPGSDSDSTDDDCEAAGAGAGEAEVEVDCTAGDVAAICGLLSIADAPSTKAAEGAAGSASGACAGCGSRGCDCLCSASPLSDGTIEVDVVGAEADIYSSLHSRTLTNDAEIDVLGA